MKQTFLYLFLFTCIAAVRPQIEWYRCTRYTHSARDHPEQLVPTSWRPWVMIQASEIFVGDSLTMEVWSTRIAAGTPSAHQYEGATSGRMVTASMQQLHDSVYLFRMTWSYPKDSVNLFNLVRRQ